MSKKNAQHWYQIHKARAASESVEASKEVAGARLKVQELERERAQLNANTSDAMLSGVRRLFFGRNEREERIFLTETALGIARSIVNQAVNDARKKGERAYASDWASRNPEKVK